MNRIRCVIFQKVYIFKEMLISLALLLVLAFLYYCVLKIGLSILYFKKRFQVR